ncbi:restriction endonuclease subunit S [Parageobacillus thermoglucosidasius]|uniref:restriction endonuclease subunit S n=1 Tax=Parageobacillus thermoglucosidasius TaxID=1426 RepID=UPI000B580F09|nr:restriction endonuclease subunit S [Parageobacillus thermoglucosidasius]OUM88571.1 MAG: hypothetical protein BAA00_19090 [Parageobacillus thermoglucosidasius]
MGFETVKLKDLTINLDNKRKPLNELERKSLKKKGLYPYCGANGVLDYIDEFIFDQEILCIAEDGGSWGFREKCAYIINEPCWVNNHAHVLVAKENVNVKYLCYYLNYTDLSKHITGTTRGKLTKSALEKIEVKIPDYSTQNKIVNALDKAQELIDKRKAQIEALDQLTQSVFLEMFGDPLRNNKNFEVVKLGEYTTHVSSGVTPRGGQSAYVPQGIPLIRSQNVHMNKLNLDDVVFITEEVHESMKRSQLRKYDVLLNITGASIGRVAVYLGENNQANVNQHVCIIRLTEGVNPFYLSYYIASPQFQYSIKLLNSGATREALNYTQIKNFNILLPPLELQNKFAEIVQKIESQKDLLQKSLEELENNFHSLMQRAFKGELFNEQ